ncbi:MAG TPA: hypothetical protein VGF55_21805 [Gemmataceae bacterium]|jgi:hypothetical protein
MPSTACPFCLVPAAVADLEAVCERCNYRWPCLPPPTRRRTGLRAAIIVGVVGVVLVAALAGLMLAQL